MKVDHVFGGHLYVISSFGDARNPLFIDDDDLSFFRSNMKQYLEKICDIYAYAHQVNQFQYLVKIKDRDELECFFYEKQAKKKVKGRKNVSHEIYNPEAILPPDSYLIFSQEVSNCLNSYAKKFNFRHKRKGGLFGDRYSKYLIESEEEMDFWIEKINNMEKLVLFEEEWEVEEVCVFKNTNGECCSRVYYEGEGRDHDFFNNFMIWTKSKLRGCFDSLPPKHIKAADFLPKFLSYIKIKGIEPPW